MLSNDDDDNEQVSITTIFKKNGKKKLGMNATKVASELESELEVREKVKGWSKMVDGETTADAEDIDNLIAKFTKQDLTTTGQGRSADGGQQRNKDGGMDDGGNPGDDDSGNKMGNSTGGGANDNDDMNRKIDDGSNK